MISIFKTSAAASPASALGLAPRVLSQLVQALHVNLIQAKSLNHADLLAKLDQVSDAVEKTAPEERVLEASREACGSIQNYFRQLTNSIDSVGLDLSTSIRALASILYKESDAHDNFLNKMETIRDRIPASTSLDDIHSLRLQLDTCLSSLRSEIFSAREAQKLHKDSLNKQMLILNRSVSALRSVVPQNSENGAAICILRIRRLKAIGDRYSKPVAQRLADYVTQILLVRWPAAFDITPYSEDCIVVVDKQNVDLDFHRSALRRLASERIMFTTMHEGHELMLPVSIDWTVTRAPANNDIRTYVTSFVEGMEQKDSNSASLDKALGLHH